ncbi:hypothetical protein L7F22_032520 [Adiantum nelumboides]|nr:hypothetical protein [Adiantum nelumboides]
MQDHVLKKINQYPDHLSSKKEVQSFVGCLQWIAPQYPQLAKDLLIFKALDRCKSFFWHERLTRAIQQIKLACSILPPLRIPTDKPLAVYSDASEEAWDGIVCEIDNDEPIICRWASGRFSDTETREISESASSSKPSSSRRKAKELTLCLHPETYKDIEGLYRCKLCNKLIASDYLQNGVTVLTKEQVSKKELKYSEPYILPPANAKLQPMESASNSHTNALKEIAELQYSIISRIDAIVKAKQSATPSTSATPPPTASQQLVPLNYNTSASSSILPRMFLALQASAILPDTFPQSESPFSAEDLADAFNPSFRWGNSAKNLLAPHHRYTCGEMVCQLSNPEDYLWQGFMDDASMPYDEQMADELDFNLANAFPQPDSISNSELEVINEDDEVRRLNPVKMETDDVKVEEPSTSASTSSTSLKGVSKIGDMTIIDIDGLNQEQVWKVFEFIYNSVHYGVRYKELTQREAVIMITAGFQGLQIDDQITLAQINAFIDEVTDLECARLRMKKEFKQVKGFNSSFCNKETKSKDFGCATAEKKCSCKVKNRRNKYGKKYKVARRTRKLSKEERKKVRCYICQKEGHIALECPKRKKRFGNAVLPKKYEVVYCNRFEKHDIPISEYMQYESEEDETSDSTSSESPTEVVSTFSDHLSCLIWLENHMHFQRKLNMVEQAEEIAKTEEWRRMIHPVLRQNHGNLPSLVLQQTASTDFAIPKTAAKPSPSVVEKQLEKERQDRYCAEEHQLKAIQAMFSALEQVNNKIEQLHKLVLNTQSQSAAIEAKVDQCHGELQYLIDKAAMSKIAKEPVSEWKLQRPVNTCQVIPFNEKEHVSYFSEVWIKLPKIPSFCVDALWDTGAALSYLNQELVPPQPRQKLCHGIPVSYANNSRGQINHTVQCQIALTNLKAQVTLYLHPHPHTDLTIGSDVISKLTPWAIQPTDLITFSFNSLPYTITTKPRGSFLVGGVMPKLPNPTKELQYQQLFDQAKAKWSSELKICEDQLAKQTSDNPLAFWEREEYWISLPGNPEPKGLKATHPGMSIEDANLCKIKIDQMLKDGLIFPSNNPYACQAFYVNNHSEQKRGKKRLVINYKPINDWLEHKRFPLPLKDDLLRRIKDCQDHVLKKINQYPDQLSSKKEVQSFVGCLQWIAPQYPQLAKDLLIFKALDRCKSFFWHERLTRAVQQIKLACSILPPLRIRTDKPLAVYSDASEEAWGGILCEIDNDEPIICRWASGRFSDTETKYHSIQKELLAEVNAVLNFRLFLIGHKVILRSDLKHFDKFFKEKNAGKVGNSRIYRWDYKLSHFDITYEYVPGIKNNVADLLSRIKVLFSVTGFGFDLANWLVGLVRDSCNCIPDLWLDNLRTVQAQVCLWFRFRTGNSENQNI